MSVALAPDAVATAARKACLLEVGSEKPGNVTPTQPFRDMDYDDFRQSAVAIGPEMGRAGERGVGRTILTAIQATRRYTQANTNLGIVLLFAPLAKAALTQHNSLRAGLSQVLRDLTIDDARSAYRAIRLARPGGLEAKVQHDVRAEPTVNLREAMAGAVARDSVASEYLSDFAITYERGLPTLKLALDREGTIDQAISQTYLALLAAVPDTLIARKHGPEISREISSGAARVLAVGGVYSRAGRRAMAAFDTSLRRADNSLNPGTTADLVAATLFVALLEGVVLPAQSIENSVQPQ